MWLVRRYRLSSICRRYLSTTLFVVFLFTLSTLLLGTPDIHHNGGRGLHSQDSAHKTHDEIQVRNEPPLPVSNQLNHDDLLQKPIKRNHQFGRELLDRVRGNEAVGDEESNLQFLSNSSRQKHSNLNRHTENHEFPARKVDERDVNFQKPIRYNSNGNIPKQKGDVSRDQQNAMKNLPNSGLQYSRDAGADKVFRNPPMVVQQNLLVSTNGMNNLHNVQNKNKQLTSRVVSQITTGQNQVSNNHVNNVQEQKAESPRNTNQRQVARNTIIQDSGLPKKQQQENINSGFADAKQNTGFVIPSQQNVQQLPQQQQQLPILSNQPIQSQKQTNNIANTQLNLQPINLAEKQIQDQQVKQQLNVHSQQHQQQLLNHQQLTQQEQLNVIHNEQKQQQQHKIHQQKQQQHWQVQQQVQQSGQQRQQNQPYHVQQLNHQQQPQPQQPQWNIQQQQPIQQTQQHQSQQQQWNLQQQQQIPQNQHPQQTQNQQPDLKLHVRSQHQPHEQISNIPGSNSMNPRQETPNRDIVWSAEADQTVPQALTWDEVDNWVIRVRQQPITVMETGSDTKCGRPPNQYLETADGTKLCGRYRNTFNMEIEGELFSYYLARLLDIKSVPPLVLATIDSQSNQWSLQKNKLSQANWNDGKIVTLTKFIDGLHRAKLPRTLKVSVNTPPLTVSSSELKSLSPSDLSYLIQWTDLIVFDYLIAHIDRITNHQEGVYLHDDATQDTIWSNQPIHNLAVSKDSVLWFIDNETGFRMGYRALYHNQVDGEKYRFFHKTLLHTTCMFRQETVNKIGELYHSANPFERLLTLIHEKEPLAKRLNVEIPGIRNDMPELFNERVSDVYQWMEECR